MNACGAGTVRHDVLPVRDLQLHLGGGAGRARARALGQDLQVRDGRVTLPLLRTWEIVVLDA